MHSRNPIFKPSIKPATVLRIMSIRHPKKLHKLWTRNSGTPGRGVSKRPGNSRCGTPSDNAIRQAKFNDNAVNLARFE